MCTYTQLELLLYRTVLIQFRVTPGEHPERTCDHCPNRIRAAALSLTCDMSPMPYTQCDTSRTRVESVAYKHTTHTFIETYIIYSTYITYYIHSSRDTYIHLHFTIPNLCSLFTKALVCCIDL